jgi:hypothetical protein
LIANCTFEPPVSTPISRRIAIEALRISLVFLVRQRLRRRDGDRVAGVDAHRVEVLDRADDDAVVRLVADDLHLELLPADQALLDEELVVGERSRPRLQIVLELVRVVGDAAAGAADVKLGPDRPSGSRTRGLSRDALLHGQRFERVGDARLAEPRPMPSSRP